MQGAELADYAVKVAEEHGASYCEARFERTAANTFLLKNGTPELSGFEQRSGIGIRLLIGGSLGFVSTNQFSREKIRRMISRIAHSLSMRSALHEKVALSNEKPFRGEDVVKQRIDMRDLSAEEKLAFLTEAEKALLASGVNCTGRFLTLSDSISEEHLVTSEGTSIRSSIPRVEFNYYLTVSANGKSMQRYWMYGNSGGYEFVKRWDVPSLMQREARTLHTMLTRGKKFPKGITSLVAGPQVTGIMVHESGGHPYEADRIFGREAAQAGESFISPERVGERIGSEAVTIVDDPTLKNSFGYYRFDNEGVRARRKVLLEKGRIHEFLHNRQTAALMGLRSNGSSRSVDFDKESIVRMSNTFMLPGKYSEEELIEGIREGVLMRNFMEWNIDDQRMNQRYVGAECYRIHRGEVAGPLLSPTLEITTPALYSSIDACGKNLEMHAGSCGKGEPMQGISVWLGGPSIRLRKVRVT